jgi:hypothetical protein
MAGMNRNRWTLRRTLVWVFAVFGGLFFLAAYAKPWWGDAIHMGIILLVISTSLFAWGKLPPVGKPPKG